MQFVKQSFSNQMRKWTLWPRSWVKTKLDRPLYRTTILKVMNEKVAG